jgi:hypothetical protein
LDDKKQIEQLYHEMYAAMVIQRKAGTIISGKKELTSLIQERSDRML